MEVVKGCYQLSSQLPDSEKFGLMSQLRRAVVSIPTNIAEGSGRRSDGYLAVFLRTSLGSLYETETLLQICIDLGYLSQSEVDPVNTQLKQLAVKLNNFLTAVQPKVVREQQAGYDDVTPSINETT